MMAENNPNKRPAKSILKTSTSIERQDQPKKPKEQRFDEMNIIATLHPPDKDYGHMKIEEPKTPYSEYNEEADLDLEADPTASASADQLDATILAAKLQASINRPTEEASAEDDDDDDEDEFAQETPEERKARLEFEAKRKKHYNEFQAIQLARKLMEEEDEDDDGEDEDATEPKKDGFESK